MGCPAHVLKGKTGKLEPRIEVCMFVGYPKGTRGGLFYSPSDKKVFVSTNVTFLEYDYMTTSNLSVRLYWRNYVLIRSENHHQPLTNDKVKRLLFLFRIS